MPGTPISAPPSPLLTPPPSPPQAARNTLLSVNFVIFLLAALVVKFKLSTGLRERLGVGPTSGHTSSDSLSDSGSEDAVLNGGALPKSSPFAPRHRSIQASNPTP